MIEKVNLVIGSHKKLFLVGLMLVAVGFQVTAALQKSFWEDEAFTATVAQQDLSSVLVTITKDVHPPLYLVVISSWEKIFGSSELALRMFSILCVILTLLLIYKLTVEILDDRAGIVVMVLLSLSPLYIMFGHNARYYALAAALSMMVTLSLLLYLRPTYYPSSWLVFIALGYITTLPVNSLSNQFILFPGGRSLAQLRLYQLLIPW
jgi:4-amino-4-deoxy-L-arabinose transferase-like glycosyltransferase